MTFDAAPGYLSADDCRLADLIDLVSRKTDLADYPYASTVEQNVLIYDGARLRKQLSRPECQPRIETELARALLDGPGIVMLAGAFDDPWVIERTTWQFEAIIAAQRAAAGDHFAAAGQNDRVWNVLEKLALRAPELFADYYANDLIATVCRAWLGSGYQVTSQVNVVSPGGAAQEMHREYHLGFASGSRPPGSRRTCTGSLPCSPCKARWRISCRWARETRCSSTPSTGSRRAPRPASSAGPCQKDGHGSNWRPNSVRGAPAARPGGTPTPRRRSADDQLR